MAKSEIYRLEGPQASDEVRSVSSVLSFAADRWSSLSYIFAEYGSVVEQKKEQFTNYLRSFDGEEAQKSLAYFLESMSYTGPISNSNGIHLTELFVICSIFIMVSWLGTMVGCYLTSFLFSAIFLDFGAVLLGVLIIPIIATRYYNDYGFRNLPLAGKQILAATFIFEQGVIFGYLNRNHAFSAPFMIVPQIICSLLCFAFELSWKRLYANYGTASFVVPLVFSRYLDRGKIYTVIFSTTLLAQIVIAHLLGHLTGGLFTMASIYSTLTCLLIQFTLAYRLRIDFDDVFVTMHYIFILATVKLIGMGVFAVREVVKN